MLFALLVVTIVVAVVGIGLMIAMMRRNEPLLGLAGLTALLTSGVIGVVYGLLSSA